MTFSMDFLLALNYTVVALGPWNRQTDRQTDEQIEAKLKALPNPYRRRVGRVKISKSSCLEAYTPITRPVLRNDTSS